MLLIKFSKFRELNYNTEKKSQFWSDNIEEDALSVTLYWSFSYDFHCCA